MDTLRGTLKDIGIKKREIIKTDNYQTKNTNRDNALLLLLLLLLPAVGIVGLNLFLSPLPLSLWLIHWKVHYLLENLAS